MATSTESSLQPKTVPDSTWLQDELLRPIVAGVLEDVRRKDLENAYLAMESFPALWERFGAAWATGEGLRWAKDLSNGIVDAMAGQEFKSEPRYSLATGVLDVAATLPMSVELGLIRAVADLDIPALGKRIRESHGPTRARLTALCSPRRCCEPWRRRNAASPLSEQPTHHP